MVTFDRDMTRIFPCFFSIVFFRYYRSETVDVRHIPSAGKIAYWRFFCVYKTRDAGHHVKNNTAPGLPDNPRRRERC